MRTTQPNVELALWSTVVDLEKNHKQNVMITATGIDKGHRCTYIHTHHLHTWLAPSMETTMWRWLHTHTHQKGHSYTQKEHKRIYNVIVYSRHKDEVQINLLRSWWCTCA